MPTNARRRYGGCPTYAEMSLADRKAAEQHGLSPSTFMHREYFLPPGFGDCSFAGLANLGCSPPGTDTRGRCWSLMKTEAHSVRVHEFGHNLGLWHGAEGGEDYG